MGKFLHNILKRAMSFSMFICSTMLFGMEGSGMMIASRNGMVVEPVILPYAYEAEWIEADQTGVSDLNNGPFIRTAYIPQLDDDFHFSMV